MSALFAILSVLLDTSRNSQTDLVKFCVLSPHLFGNYGIIPHKKEKNKQIKKIPKTLPIFFLTYVTLVMHILHIFVSGLITLYLLGMTLILLEGMLINKSSSN